MGASFALALCVEILQLVLKTGVFDLGNLLFHTIGAGIGIVFVIVWKYAFSRKSAFSYVALNMNAVAMINDAVGGVTVTVPEDMTQVDPSFAEGAAVTLTGDQALKFTRYRDTEKDFSNNSRMERQKQYLVNFMGQAVKAMKADMGLPVSLYQSLTDVVFF